MQLIEAALAFAITMLALSLVVSSFVEIIHRIFSMREAGLKYVLGQMFDQVLAKYVAPTISRAVAADTTIAAAARNERIRELLTGARTAFVERMSANRAPMGVTPKATPTDPAAQVANNARRAFGLWSGRDLAAMTPAEFMERLGSIDIGQTIADADAAATNAAQQAGATAADAVNVVLKDVTQKFEAFGREASVYFEGRARLLSVAVAIALAFLAHVDAVDLFRTYLRDPNARAKVIEQSEAVTAQHKAAKEAANAVKAIDPKDATLTPAEVKEQIEKIKQDWTEAIGKAECRRSSNMPILACRSAGTTNASSGRRCTSWPGLAKTRTRKRAKASRRCGRTAARTSGEGRYGVRCRPRPASGSIFSSGDCWSGSARRSGITPSPASPTSATRRAERRPPMRKRALPLSPRGLARHSRRRRSMPSGFRARRKGEGRKG